MNNGNNNLVKILKESINSNDSKIYSNFNQNSSSTYRIYSSSPNLQNIKKDNKIRKSFVPSKGNVFVGIDFSQIQLRIIGSMGKDFFGYSQYYDDLSMGKDIHQETANRLKCTREQAKDINFSFCYGVSHLTISKKLNIDGNEAFRIMQDFYEKYYEVNMLRQYYFLELKNNGYVRSKFGNISRIEFSGDPNHKHSLSCKALNHVVQMNESSCIKMIANNIRLSCIKDKIRSSLVLMVHDELIYDVNAIDLDRFRSIISKEIDSFDEFLLPLKCVTKIGDSWAEVH